jgi:tetratricopeptide (TPR) repeat protein
MFLSSSRPSRNCSFSSIFGGIGILVCAGLLGYLGGGSMAIGQQPGTASPPVASGSEPADKPNTTEEGGLEDFDKAMDLKIESKEDIEQLSKVIELLESSLKKGLNADDQQIARQLLASTALERAKLQIQELVKSRINEGMARRVQKRILEDLKLATENDPNLGEAYLLTAKLSASTEPETARKALDQAIANLGRDREKRAEAYAIRALLQENFDDKIADLRQAMRDFPESVEVQRTLFAFLLDKSRYQEVYEVGTELLAANAKNPIALQATVSALLEMDRNEEALKLLNDRIEENPDDFGLLALRGNVLLSEDRLDDAIADGSRLIELQGTQLEGYFLRAKAYLQRSARAKEGAESADLRLARRDIDAALDLKPNSVEGIRLRAAVASQQKRYDEAIQDTVLLAKNSPQESFWLEQLATLYQLDDRPSLAVKVADQLIALDSANWRAYRIRGDAHLSVGDQGSAITDYKQALRVLKDDREERSGLLNNLAWLLATSTEDSLRDGAESITLGREACELTEYKEAHILSTLAAGYAESGDFAEAIKWSLKAVELGGHEGHEQLEQLKNELNSYQQGKPWREKQEVKEKKPPAIKPQDAIET